MNGPPLFPRADCAEKSKIMYRVLLGGDFGGDRVLMRARFSSSAFLDPDVCFSVCLSGVQGDTGRYGDDDKGRLVK